MITLDQEQWLRLQDHDERNFVGAVCDGFLLRRPEHASQGRQVVMERMWDAFKYTVAIGMSSTPRVVEFLHLSGDMPGFYTHPSVDRQLRKPGATPEERFDDLMAVVHMQMRGL